MQSSCRANGVPRNAIWRGVGKIRGRSKPASPSANSEAPPRRFQAWPGVGRKDFRVWKAEASELSLPPAAVSLPGPFPFAPNGTNPAAANPTDVLSMNSRRVRFFRRIDTPFGSPHPNAQRPLRIIGHGLAYPNQSLKPTRAGQALPLPARFGQCTPNL